MSEQNLDQLRKELQDMNLAILNLLNKRAKVVEHAHRIKTRDGIPAYVPEREQQMLSEILGENRGPFSDKTISHLFKEIFRACAQLQETDSHRQLQISRAKSPDSKRIEVGRVVIGDKPIVIAGPCAVESEAQMEQIASELADLGIGILRGGTFKPRSSPYSFQGMGEPGLKILRKAGEDHHMATVTEVMDTRAVELVANYADILQIGARNMHNYSLLREVGRCEKPVLLKRGLSATIDEFLWAAEYIASEGNDNIILCERGIRTFETQTRNTLDISAVALLKAKTYLPVIADVSHAAGRKDILAALARASMAAGADGIMVEVHPFPSVARSDSQQQLDIEEFKKFLSDSGLEQKSLKKRKSGGVK